MNVQKKCGCASSYDDKSRCGAVEILWKGSQRYRGIDGFDLCARVGMPIVRSAFLKSREASMIARDSGGKTGCTISIPKEDPEDRSAREGLLVYHEFAHYLLLLQGIKSSVWSSHTEYYRATENWCDNFALIMLASMFDIEAADDAGGHAFLRAGEMLQPPRSDIFLAERLRRLAHTGPRATKRSRDPLFRLARMLKNDPYTPNT